jgi:hypothetical protein
MPWKNGKTAFHAMELFPKLLPCRGKRAKVGSMAWKIGGLKTNDDSPSGNGDKSGFHVVELFEKVASMPWKTAQFGFHAVENRRIRLPCRGTFCGAIRNDGLPPPSRSRGFCRLCQNFCGGEGRRFGRIWAETGKDAADAP